MPTPIETLMNEHRLIEKVLGSLETLASAPNPGGGSARATIARFAEFFREFADRCHHGKEEDLLFEALQRHGMPREFGPIRVMLDEHEVGRSCVRVLSTSGGGDGPVGDDEWERVRAAAARFIAMLRQHIQKEDNILFRMATENLPESVLRDLERRFAEFERDEMGDDAHQRLHALAEALASEFPPTTPSPGHAVPCGGGCA